MANNQNFAATAQGVTPARLGAITGPNDAVADWITVHFNPESLQIEASNELKENSKNNERQQYIGKTSVKLTMELQFDTTLTGADVTEDTGKVRGFLLPGRGGATGPNREPPPAVVLFEWGRFRFKGVAETYRETISFFSANGVPMRATVSLSLSKQELAFEPPGSGAPTDAGPVDGTVGSTASSPAEAANQIQNPGAARALAASNGQESLRFGAGAGIAVSASAGAGFSAGAGIGGGLSAGAGVGGGFSASAGLRGGAGITLNPPTVFATGGIGAGSSASAGGGIGVGGGIGGGISLGISGGGGFSAGSSLGAGIGVGLSTGVSAGVSSLARLSATEGAFAALRSPGVRTVSIDTSGLLPAVAASNLTTGSGFRVGGRSAGGAGTGLRAQVSGSVGGRLSFD